MKHAYCQVNKVHRYETFENLMLELSGFLGPNQWKCTIRDAFLSKEDSKQTGTVYFTVFSSHFERIHGIFLSFRTRFQCVQ